MAIKVVEKGYLETQFKNYHKVVKPLIDANTNAINVLNGDVNTNGSVANTVNSAISSLLNGAPDAFDTLKEISDWIETHGSSATEMNTAIQTNASAIEVLNGNESTAGSVAYQIAEAINNLQLEIETTNINFNTLFTEIQISGDSTVVEGETITLTSDVSGVAWSTSDATIATVENGVVTGVGAGEVTITASKSDYTSGTKVITVTAAPETVQIDGVVTVQVGNTITLTSNAANTTWSTSDATIATVENGVVTGVGAGTATITASAEGYNPGTKVIEVTVAPENPEEQG